MSEQELLEDFKESLGRACLEFVELAASNTFGLGIDIQLISELNLESSTFIERNFTLAEIEYCRNAQSPAASFSARWAAKEAVAKAMCNFNLKAGRLSKDMGDPMIEVEILPASTKAPELRLYGYAEETAKRLGISEIKISLTHSGIYAAAVALAVGSAEFCSAEF
ncbi:MAG TPA: 4-phosphopantetheinyl transferase [Deltaproteobacteria bacterium]|nr:4-phosphopantetheinyl transferase [Deltaproteobacteria bacterium]